MQKIFSIIVAAATVAGAITLITAPTGHVDAQPVAKPITDAMTACNDRPWPYVNCVGTRFGNPKIRLISIDRRAD